MKIMRILAFIEKGINKAPYCPVIFHFKQLICCVSASVSFDGVVHLYWLASCSDNCTQAEGNWFIIASSTIHVSFVKFRNESADICRIFDILKHIIPVTKTMSLELPAIVVDPVMS